MSQPFDLFDLATNPLLENEGVFTTLDGFGDIEWKIASIENDAFKGFLASSYKAHKSKIDAAKGDDDNAEVKALMKGIYLEGHARYVLVGWKGTVPARGQNLEYSYDNAYLLLSKIRKLHEVVLEKANDVSLFKVARDWEDTKN
jgi:hypothetical protein